MKTKKAMALTLCMLMAGTTVACGKTVEEFDGSKTQIFVQVFNGGYGTQFVDAAGARFEELYKDYELNGRVGVEVVCNPVEETGTAMMNNIAVNTNDVFFVEQGYYSEFRNSKDILEITDILTEKLTAYGEDVSIADKMTQAQRDYYGQDGKYYGLSWTENFEGFIIDEDLFYQQGFYYTKERDDNLSASAANTLITAPVQKNTEGEYATLVTENGGTYWKTNNGEYLSKGPDGVYGTYDDGQAATYDEFFALCDYIKTESDGVTPVIMLGKGLDGGLNWLYQQLCADYEGQEAKLSSTFSGTSNYIVESINADGSVTLKEPTEISVENHMEVYKTAGKYYAATFLEKLLSGNGMNYFNTRTFQSTTTQYLAQEYFVYSIKDAEKYAFLFDGVWWENEATETIATMNERFGGADNKYAKENRNFKQYSLPKATREKVGEKTTFYDNHKMLAGVRTGLGDKEEICKKFFQFCFTEESNREFNRISSIPRPLAYTLTADDKAQMSSYGRSLYELYSQDNVEVCYPMSNTDFYLDNMQIATTMAFANTRINNIDYNSFSAIFKDYKFTAKDYFNGIYERVNGLLTVK